MKPIRVLTLLLALALLVGAAPSARTAEPLNALNDIDATEHPLLRSPAMWRDDFDDDTGLHSMLDTEVVTATGHLALVHSLVNPDQYVTSGVATSVIINPLVAAVPSRRRLTSIAPGQDEFLYLAADSYLGPGCDFLSYQLSSGQYSQLHAFTGTLSLATGINGLVYMGVGDGIGGVGGHLYVYDPSNGSLDDLGTPVPTSSIFNLAAGSSGLVYGIVGLRLFSYNPTTHSFSDLGIISAEMGGWGRTALTVADDGKVYGGYVTNNEGRLFVYDPGVGWIIDKGQVLGQQSINALAAGSDGRIYGGTNTFCGSVGRFFAYDPSSDSVSDLAGSYGGVYALTRGKDNLIYGAARRNGYEAYLFIYDPALDTLRETGCAGHGHVSALSWASDDRIYGITGTGYGLVVYDPTSSTFSSWGTITFTYTTPAGTAVRIDVLDAWGNVLLASVNSGDSLSSLDPSDYPAIQLRANLRGDGSGTPLIDSWSVSMTVPKIYLPIIIKQGIGQSG